MEGNLKNHEELMTQFRDSVRANIKQLQNYGVATKYEDYLEEPQFEELPRMRDIGMEHFYGGGYVEEHDYKPMPGFRRHKTQEIGQSGDLLGMRALFRNLESPRVRQFRDKKIKKTIKETLVRVDHVMILGPAGSGKSTIMKRFVRDADAGRIPQIQEADRLVHALDARRFDPKKKISVHEFLFRNMTIRPSDDAIQVGYSWMLLNSKKVVLAVDSLDTLGYSLDNESDVISPDSHARPATILYNIFTGNIFLGCKILSSSREHQVRSYKGDLRARKIISLAGLTTESIKRLVSGFLGHSEGERVYEYLQKFPDLLLMCQTPIFLVFSLVGVKFLGADGSEFVPNTMTGVMVNLLLSLIHSKHARTFKKYQLDEDVIRVLTKMKELSYNGTKQGKVLFSENDLQAVKLSTDEVTDVAIVVPGSGRSQSEQRVLDGDSVTYFAHQSIEEMLCAMYIAEMTQADFQSFVSEFLHKPYFAVIRRFLCGLLLDPKVYEVASIQLVKVENLTMFREQLTASLKEQLQRVEDEDRLELYYSLRESGAGAKDIIPAMERFSFKSSHTTLDMFTIGSVLRHGTKLEVLDMRRSSTEQATHFRSGLGTGNLKISTLDLFRNTDMGVEGLKSVGEISNQSKVEELDLRSCKLSPRQLEALKDGLDSAKISSLDLEGNTNMSIAGLKSVGEISKQSKVEELDLRSCKLSLPQLEALKVGLDSTKLRKLDIGQNERLGISGLEVVGQIVQECNVEKLLMYDCNTKDEEIMSFKKGLAGAKLKMLDVYGNMAIRTEGFGAIAEIAYDSDSIELDVRECEIDEAEIQRLFGKIPGLRLRYTNERFEEAHIENPAVVCTTSASPSDSPEKPTDLQMQDKQSCSDVDLNATAVVSPSAAVSFREDQQTEQQHNPEELPMKLTDQQLSPFASDMFAKMSSESRKKIEHDTDVAGKTSTSPSDSQKMPTDLQMQEKQSCGDVDLNASAVASPNSTAGSRKVDQQTEQQHDPVVGMTSTSPSDSPEKPTDLQMQEKQSCSDVDLSVSAVIGENGGPISLYGNTVSFPPGALHDAVNVKLAVDTDRSKWPKQYTCITSILDCDISGATLHKPVKVEMTTWCTSPNKPLPILVLRKSDAGAEWQIVQNISLGPSRKVTFETTMFSWIILAYLKELLGFPIQCHLQNQIYYNNKAHFSGVVRVDDEAVTKEIQTELAGQQYKTLLPVAEKITATRKDQIKMKLSCVKPEHCKIEKECFSGEVGRIVDKTYTQYGFNLEPIPSDNVPNGCLQMQYTTQLNDGKSESLPLRPLWPINFKTAGRRASASASALTSRQETRTESGQAQTRSTHHQTFKNCQVILPAGAAGDIASHMKIDQGRSIVAGNIAMDQSSMDLKSNQDAVSVHGNLNQTRNKNPDGSIVAANLGCGQSQIRKTTESHISYVNVSPTATTGSGEEDQQIEKQYNPVASPTVTVGSREEDKQTEQQHDPVVGMTPTSPSDSPEKLFDLQMQEKQSCSDVDLNASAVRKTSASPSDSPETPSDFQMQERQSCRDAELSASVVTSPTATTGFREEDQQTEQQHNPVQESLLHEVSSGNPGEIDLKRRRPKDSSETSGDAQFTEPENTSLKEYKKAKSYYDSTHAALAVGLAICLVCFLYTYFMK